MRPLQGLALLLALLPLLVSLAAAASSSSSVSSSSEESTCFLLGEGGCSSQDNGKDDDDDDDEDWPLAVGEKSLEECCQKCTKTKGCTAFHLGKAKTSKRLCALYGGQVKLTPGGGEGQCYRVSKKKGGKLAENEPTAEGCQKFVDRACGKRPIKDKNDEIEERYQTKKVEAVLKQKEDKKKSEENKKSAKTQAKVGKADSLGAKDDDKPAKETESKKKDKTSSRDAAATSKTSGKSAEKSPPKAGKLPKADNAGSSGQKVDKKKEVDDAPKRREKRKAGSSAETPKKAKSNPQTDEPSKPGSSKPNAKAKDKVSDPVSSRSGPKTKEPSKQSKAKGTATVLGAVELQHSRKKQEFQPPKRNPRKTYNGLYLNDVGPGGCRGPGWDLGKWPKVFANESLDSCAMKCARTDDCNAIHILDRGGGAFECLHFGHEEVINVPRLGGFCYEVDDDRKVTPDEEAKVEKIDGPVMPSYLGRGMCRGPDWSTGVWPLVLSRRSIAACAYECARRPRCTAFDVSGTDKKKDEHDCLLYGHRNVIPASAVPGECFTLKDRRDDLLLPDEDDDFDDDDDDNDDDDDDDEDVDEDVVQPNTPYKTLGVGQCRGPGWADSHWPKDKGWRTFKNCANLCGGTPECTSFDVREKKRDKLRCTLYRHKHVEPAWKTPGRCFTVVGIKRWRGHRVKVTHSKEPKASMEKPEGFQQVGEGLCRGPNWQRIGWPKDMGLRGIGDCFKACQESKGCTAFDLVPTKGSSTKTECLLYGHKDIVPASNLDGHCYVVSFPTDKNDTNTKKKDELKPSDLIGNIKVKLLGHGACRGQGWQGGRWPLVMGRHTIEDCGKLCLASKGCTAFHVADEDDGRFDCFLFAHKDVAPASGVPGDCFTATGSIRPRKKKKKKNFKVPQFDEPKVMADNTVDSADDEEWLFDPPPPEVRSRSHISQILGLDQPQRSEMTDLVETTLRNLKKIYENSIRPLETPYKYRELSNRHFGDPEIFNKPLVVLMGPYSGGKSTMINYLLGTEFTKNAFRAVAEPSPGFNFNIALHGDREEDLEGTELSAEWTFSNLQKFGQEFLKKLKGKKMPNKLLERATFAEIPGVLETGSRKVDRRYPFNDACQWFIDHADLILLVYDYAKLDIGKETEALLDQLKGRESQVRIILNKADQITAEELLKIQGNLVWNVSPLMASLEPPTLYAGSFWSRPYEESAPKRLLMAQEMALLVDIKQAIDKRVEHRIATARRFAVRVRNHAKMVDCYLTTYKNAAGLFSDKEAVATEIVEHPERYHIYEGVSSMATNISRYDLPDPQTYRRFFTLHKLYEFPMLQSTCTFFRGCPVNKLDQAIAYDLPELLTKFRRKANEIQGGKKRRKNK